MLADNADLLLTHDFVTNNLDSILNSRPGQAQDPETKSFKEELQSVLAARKTREGSKWKGAVSRHRVDKSAIQKAKPSKETTSNK